MDPVLQKLADFCERVQVPFAVAADSGYERGRTTYVKGVWKWPELTWSQGYY